MNDAYHCVMKYPIENLTSLEFTDVTERPGSIFLAGPCPREDFDSDWRIEAEKILDSLGFKGVIFNPTNKHFKELISKVVFCCASDGSRPILKGALLEAKNGVLAASALDGFRMVDALNRRPGKIHNFLRQYGRCAHNRA